jgi:hypothetical protein
LKPRLSVLDFSRFAASATPARAYLAPTMWLRVRATKGTLRILAVMETSSDRRPAVRSTGGCAALHRTVIYSFRRSAPATNASSCCGAEGYDRSPEFERSPPASAVRPWITREHRGVQPLRAETRTRAGAARSVSIAPEAHTTCQ